jgi:serine/threonine protein kinase
MDPIILKKFLKTNNNNLGYDEKADIWSIGTVCYELLLGKTLFNAKNIKDLVVKVESGLYSIPKTFSKEVISFLTAMLQYEGKNRLSSKELLKHPFLTKNVKNFTKINSGNNSNRVYSPNFIKINSDKNVKTHARTTTNSFEGPISEGKNSSKKNINQNHGNNGVTPFSYKDYNPTSKNVGNNKVFHRTQTIREIPLSGKQTSNFGKCITPNRGELIKRPNYALHPMKLTKKVHPKIEIEKPAQLKNVVGDNSKTNRGTNQKTHKSNKSFNYELGIDNHYKQKTLLKRHKKLPSNNELDNDFCCIY